MSAFFIDRSMHSVSSRAAAPARVPLRGYAVYVAVLRARCGKAFCGMTMACCSPQTVGGQLIFSRLVLGHCCVAAVPVAGMGVNMHE